MRWILALLVLLATPASAAEWGQYGNARFGYGIDVPPGFVLQAEADNGDGAVFATPTARLTVFGGNIVVGDFESEVRTRQGFAAANGWTITYQTSTPNRASFSGRRGGRVLYARLIALCDPSQFASFQLEYSVADLTKFDAVVDRLVRSLGCR